MEMRCGAVRRGGEREDGCSVGFVRRLMGGDSRSPAIGMCPVRAERGGSLAWKYLGRAAQVGTQLRWLKW